MLTYAALVTLQSILWYRVNFIIKLKYNFCMLLCIVWKFVSRTKGRELREYLLEEDTKKNIWPQERGSNKKLEKISKDLLNRTSGQILLGWSIQGGWDRRIFNISSSFFTNCHNAYELKCVNKQMLRHFPLDFPDYL